jgi:hypothetical protein
MEATTTNTVVTLVENYLTCWNETDPARRQALIATTWEPDATYTDPLFAVAGSDQINDLIGGFQQQYPGLSFVQTGQIEAHHNLVRFTWDLVAPTGDVIAKGADVGIVSDAGRISGIGGFFDQAPVLG